jgi:hypothetical protein
MKILDFACFGDLWAAERSFLDLGDSVIAFLAGDSRSTTKMTIIVSLWMN